MADVFAPRKVFAQREQFGQFHEVPRAAEGVRERSDEFRASALQHLISYEFRRWLSDHGLTVEQFASRQEGKTVRADRLRRLLRGETMMQLTDIIRFASVSPGVREVVLEYLGAARDGEKVAESELKHLRYRVAHFEWLLRELNLGAHVR